MTHPAAPSSALQSQAESLAAAVPPLLLRAKRLAATVIAGTHGRRRPGGGDDFWQFRHSQPGDPLTAIDWRQSARSDHLFIRETEWMIAHTTRLWVDPSASLRWRSRADLDSKYDRACLLAVALAVLLEQAGERISLLERQGPGFAGRSAPGHIARALITAEISGGMPDAARERSSGAVIMSDFMMPLESLAEQLQRWSAAGLTGHLLQILDPAEESLPYQGRVSLQGLEDEGEILLPQVDSLRGAYQAAMERHRRGLTLVARRYGWRFGLHHTDQSPRAALTDLYCALSRG